MTTVAEKSADLATMIDDIATAALALAEWSDGDAGVVNDGSDNQHHNNGRVLSNSNTGTYLYMFVSEGETNAVHSNTSVYTGVRIVHSTEWDTTNHRPAGFTTTNFNDPFFRNPPSAVMTKNESFTNVRHGYNVGTSHSSYTETDEYQESSYNCGEGLWVAQKGTLADRQAARTESASYFVSVRADGLQAASWSTTDGTSGMASFFSFEYLDSTFYDDHEIPVAMVYRDSAYDSTSYSNSINYYGFKSYGASHEGSEKGLVGGYRGPISHGRWGTLNPDPNDDTFFFRNPAVNRVDSKQSYAYDGGYTSSIETLRFAPVSLVHQVLPNQPGEGAAHGDVITHNTEDYRAIVQSGAGKTNAISALLRYS